MSTVQDTDLFLVQRGTTRYHVAAVDLKKEPPAVELWTPADMTKALWLDAADVNTFTLIGAVSVSQWRDKSGNAHHGNQSSSTLQPRISGTEVDFTNINHFLDLPSMPQVNGQTDFAVFLCARTGPDTAIARRQFSLNQAANERQVATRGGIDGRGDVYQLSVTNLPGTTGQSLSTWSPSVAGRYLLGMDWRQERAGTWGYGFHRRNGTVATAANQNSDGSRPPTTPTAPTSTRVSASTPSVAMGGFLTTMIVMRANDYDANIEKLEGWEAHRSGLASLLPAAHPYKAAPPTK